MFHLPGGMLLSRILWMACVLLCPAWAVAQAPEVVSEDGIRHELLDGINRMADDRRTRTTAELLAQKPTGPAALTLPAPRERELSGRELYRAMRGGTAIVGCRYKCKKCSNWHLNAASGFFLTADGVVATNYHVLNDEMKDAMGVMDGHGKIHPVTALLAADPAHDLAFLQVEGSGFEPLSLALEAPQPGDDVAVLSHPESHFWLFTTGVVSRWVDWVEPGGGAPAERYPALCITAEFAPGSSGAPVCDRRGNVVGVAQRIFPLIEQPREKVEGKPPQGPTSTYTAAVIRMAVPAKWVAALTRTPGDGGR